MLFTDFTWHSHWCLRELCLELITRALFTWKTTNLFCFAFYSPVLVSQSPFLFPRFVLIAGFKQKQPFLNKVPAMATSMIFVLGGYKGSLIPFCILDLWQRLKLEEYSFYYKCQCIRTSRVINSIMCNFCKEILIYNKSLTVNNIELICITILHCSITVYTKIFWIYVLKNLLSLLSFTRYYKCGFCFHSFFKHTQQLTIF